MKKIFQELEESTLQQPYQQQQDDNNDDNANNDINLISIYGGNIYNISNLVEEKMEFNEFSNDVAIDEVVMDDVAINDVPKNIFDGDCDDVVDYGSSEAPFFVYPEVLIHELPEPPSLISKPMKHQDFVLTSKTSVAAKQKILDDKIAATVARQERLELLSIKKK